MTEMHIFLEAVDNTWKGYFRVRFLTGIRSCELHALQRKHINLENRILHAQQNVVDDEISGVKTVKSNRDLPLNNILLDIFQRMTKEKEESAFLFTDVNRGFFELSEGQPSSVAPKVGKGRIKETTSV